MAASFLKWKLRTKILILSSIIATVPYLISPFVWERSASELVYQHEAEHLIQQTQKIEYELTTFFHSKPFIHFDVTPPSLLTTNTTITTETLRYYLENDATLKQIKLLPSTGNSVTVSQPTFSQTMAHTYSDEEYKQVAQSLTQNSNNTKPVYTNTNLGQHLAAIVPMTDPDSNTFYGTIVALIDISTLQQSLQDIQVGQSGSWYVQDATGKNIVESTRAITTRPDNRNQLIQTSTANISEANVSVQITNAEIPAQYLAVQLPDFNWTVTLVKPLSDFAGSTLQNQQTSLIVFLSSLVVILFLSLLFSKQLTDPLHEVIAGTLQIGRGNFDYKLHVKTGDEFEQLANAFNSMSTQIKQSLEQQWRDRETIAAERNKLEQIIAGITDAIVAVDLERKIIMFNPAAEQLTGYSAQDVIGHHVDTALNLSENSIKLAPEEYCPIRLNGFEGVVESKKSIQLITRDAIKKTVNLLAGQIKEGKSANLGCILTLHDVTQEHDLEEMKLDFVSMAAHELRTPLTSAKGYVEILKNEDIEFTADQKTFLDRISITIQQLSALVENLLNVSRIERGNYTIDVTPTDWESHVENVVSQLVPHAESKGLTLNIEKPKNPLPKVHADKLRITEVINNLISNAISYTESPGKITVWFERTPEEVITHIQDTGEGIPKPAQSKLFTKFFRVSGVLAQGSKGTGLGLYISKSIVEMHHGHIWVESEEDIGSTFSFSLPIAKETD